MVQPRCRECPLRCRALPPPVLLWAALIASQFCYGQTSTAALVERQAKTSEDMPQDSVGYVEEVVVTAERLEKGAMPTQVVIVQTYNALQRGKRLYNLRRYKEALPYLLVGAKRGFKWGQAMAADIYLHGRGGVQRDIEAGMGWLGVAARPQTAPAIQRYFRQAMAEMPGHARRHIENVVERYREQWSSRHWRVTCRRSVAGSPLGLGLMSLRLNKRMTCTFVDEVPVCREPLYDVGDVLSPDRPQPFQWVCPPVTG